MSPWWVVWGRDVIAQQLEGRPLDASDWILTHNGHPTTRYNRAIADRIRARVLRA